MTSGAKVARLQCAAVLLDLDGVLVDSADAIERAWRRWAATRGASESILLRQHHGRSAEDTIRTASPDLSPEEVRSEAERVIQLQIEDEVDVAPIPGSRELVTSLPHGRWAVVTACSRALAEKRLVSAGLPWPPAFVGAEDVQAGKPDPQGYRRAAEALGFAPVDCLVVEDSPAGVQAAMRARMNVVGVCTTHSSAELRQAGLRIDDLRGMRFLGAVDRSLMFELTRAS